MFSECMCKRFLEPKLLGYVYISQTWCKLKAYNTPFSAKYASLSFNNAYLHEANSVYSRCNDMHLSFVASCAGLGDTLGGGRI